ncbi:MAG: tryptophan synthase subunit alpha [Planctomycetaceae bacterium]|nr:tryptophan synthase subunit alpha [Planctomycetaceae bacterium]
METRIQQTFAALKDKEQMAFMPFVTAGDPDMETTGAVIQELAATGVDLIEVGFPYSDPIADGPVIQASYTRALGKHITVQQIFEGLAATNPASLPPILGMVSYAIIFRTGVERFLQQAKEAGLSGLIVPDLPGDEAADLFTQAKKAGLDLVQLVAPTTPRERVREILKHCSGFVYCIAVAGTTGARDSIESALLDQLRWLREETDLPLAVGFGISRPEHVAPLRQLADGVIVGSGLVRFLEQCSAGADGKEGVLGGIRDLSVAMVAATHS